MNGSVANSTSYSEVISPQFIQSLYQSYSMAGAYQASLSNNEVWEI